MKGIFSGSLQLQGNVDFSTEFPHCASPYHLRFTETLLPTACCYTGSYDCTALCAVIWICNTLSNPFKFDYTIKTRTCDRKHTDRIEITRSSCLVFNFVFVWHMFLPFPIWHNLRVSVLKSWAIVFCTLSWTWPELQHSNSTTSRRQRRAVCSGVA